METITKYVADDGTEFNTMKEAALHEKKLAAKKAIQSFLENNHADLPLAMFSQDYEGVADFIIKHQKNIRTLLQTLGID